MCVATGAAVAMLRQAVAAQGSAAQGAAATAAQGAAAAPSAQGTVVPAIAAQGTVVQGTVAPAHAVAGLPLTAVSSQADDSEWFQESEEAPGWRQWDTRRGGAASIRPENGGAVMFLFRSNYYLLTNYPLVTKCYAWNPASWAGDFCTHVSVSLWDGVLASHVASCARVL